MVSILDPKVLDNILSSCPCRITQLQQLAIFYNEHLPSPPTLVAYGLEHTGKLKTIISLLEATHVNYALVKSRECLSQRHLLGKIFAACVRASGEEDNIERQDRIDGLNTLLVNLQRLSKRWTRKFVLVLDGIDKQKGGTYALLPALARLGDEVSNLSILFTSTSNRRLMLHRSGVPYVRFTPYTRDEAIHILTSDPPPLQPESLPEEFPSISTKTLSSIYISFVAAVYDTLIIHTSSTSIPVFRKTCERLWPRFIWPMLAGESIPGRNRGATSIVAWDFARLLSRNRVLFQLEGEKALTDSLSTDSNKTWTFDHLLESYTEGTSSLAVQPPTSQSSTQPKLHQPPLLKFFPTLLLLSSYLASHTQPKHDILLFSRLSSSSSNKRRYLSSTLSKVRKTPTKSRSKSTATTQASTPGGEGGGGRPDQENDSNTNTPSKSSRKVTAALAGPLPSNEKTHKSSRLLFEKTSSIPKPFTLERLIAIVRAVHPDGIPRTKGTADKIYIELSELERLRLIVRLGLGSGGGGEVGGGGGGGNAGGSGRGTDDGILEEKWRVNVSREVVVDMGRTWGIGIEGWEIE